MLDEKEEAAQKDREKVEELEQTLFWLRDEVGAGRHVPPGIRVLSLSTNPAQDWVDLRQAALDRLKEENVTLLQRLSTLETSGAPSAPAPTAGVVYATGIGTTTTTTELVPRASWAAICEEKSAARTTKGKAAAAPETGLRRENGRVSRGVLGDTRRQSRVLR